MDGLSLYIGFYNSITDSHLRESLILESPSASPRCHLSCSIQSFINLETLSFVSPKKDIKLSVKNANYYYIFIISAKSIRSRKANRRRGVAFIQTQTSFKSLMFPSS